MVKKVAGYRTMLGKTQKDMAELYGITVQAYSRKERGDVPFKDSEKTTFRNLLRKLLPHITIDEIFFD
ncbi:MAG TPA: helix-turn-helix domain-containing protein [Candidatus Jeotgalibaca merdavium]|uniref:Helix-turn-helix domain-containing protein n=1 Tax=Candidatus Jeotgalibaca merdavium TaxID=2838627 RepID=A0A9D2I0S8_9LACT|nr:helix-turn-helix domain-containing protein [Candidatus Jeotgalibaca merdavium]